MDELVRKHKQEKKELQANIQKMKQLVPKNDKKKRKEMTQKIEEMEIELKKRHEQELSQFNESPNDSDTKPILERLEELQISLERNQMQFAENSSEGDKKVSKAQKRRERKEQEEAEREQRILQDQKESVNHIRTCEINKLDNLLKENELTLYDIQPNGDCMFEAIKHQLNLNGIQDYDVESLRKLTADSLRKNKENYLPFLTCDNENDMMNDEEYEKYCSDLELTKKWGGNVELQVMSTEIHVNIFVYRADGPISKFESKTPRIEQPLLLCFHQHLYQLGGHYNSLLKKN